MEHSMSNDLFIPLTPSNFVPNILLDYIFKFIFVVGDYFITVR